MKLSTGRVAFPLKFDNGDVENIMINPHDPKLQSRIKNFEASIKERIEKVNFERYKDLFASGIKVDNLDFDTLLNMSQEDFEHFNEQADAMANIDEDIEKEFCAEIDHVFDSDVSSKAFKYVPPLAMIPTEDGGCEMYILLVLKALALEIQKHGNKTRPRGRDLGICAYSYMCGKEYYSQKNVKS